MLNTITPRDVSTSGTLETAAFTIKANGKAFKVLIDGLYSDKIKAVIREVWTNAWDSHRAAGCPELAFDCHLPTQWEPHFSVRDYGVSMSHDDVMHLYSTVFASTKETSNNEAGKLGLGSKSPFAYSDTFTVTAWRNRQKRIYSAYIGPDYIPRISLMHEEQSDEPTGIEVSFPVKNSDIHSFKSRANLLAVGFNPTPNCAGLEPDNEDAYVIYRGTGWRLRSTLYHGVEGAQAQQGCVIYPLNSSSVPGASTVAVDLLDANLLVEFDIGQLEIAASRDALGYDEPTCQNILAKLQIVEDELTAQITERVHACTTLWEARQFYNKLKGELGMASIIKAIGELRWRGRKLTEMTNLVLPRNCTDATITDYDTTYFSSRRIRDRDRYKQQIRSKNFFPSTHMIVWQDPSKPLKRIDERLEHAFFLRTARNVNRVLLVRALPGSIIAKRIFCMLGRPTDVVMLNDVELPPHVRARLAKRVKCKVMDGKEGRSATEVDLVVNEGDVVYYARSDKAAIAVQPNGAHTLREATFGDAFSTFNSLKALGKIPNDAKGYVIPKSCANIIRGPEFIDVMTLGQNVTDEVFDKAACDKHNAMETAFADGRELGPRLVWQMVKNDCVPSDPTGVFMREHGKNIAEVREYLNDAKRMKAVCDLAQRFKNYGWSQRYNTNPYQFVLCHKIEDTYPVVTATASVVSCYQINSTLVKAFTDYINIIDANAANMVCSVAA